MGKQRLLYHENLPVEDATEPLTFEVSAANVKKAKKYGRRDEKHCAGALGLCTSLKVQEARVNLSRTLVQFTRDKTTDEYKKGDKFWKRYLTGQALRTQIVSLDQDGGFQTGSYMLADPSPSKRLGQTQGTKTRPKKPGGPVKRRVVNTRINVRPPAKRPTKKAA